jgi:hypothetical protein
MTKVFKGITYVLISIAGALALSGIASFFLPTTSDASVLWDKFGRHMMLTFLLAAYSIQVSIENQSLRKKLQGGAK